MKSTHRLAFREHQPVFLKGSHRKRNTSSRASLLNPLRSGHGASTQHSMMHFFLGIGLTLLTAFPLEAATPLDVQNLSFASLQQHFRVVLPTQRIGNASSINTLEFLHQHLDNERVLHVRTEQRYAGFLVYGGYAIIHQHQSNQPVLSAAYSGKTLTGVVYQDLASDLGSPPPHLIQNAALALEQFKSPYPAATVREERVTPVVYMGKDHKAVWAYRVSLLIQYPQRMPSRPTAILDAQSFHPYRQWDNIRTELSAAKGIGMGGNPRTGKYLFGKHLPLLDISRNDAQEQCYMQNREVTVIDMQHLYEGTNEPMQFTCKPNYLGNKTYWTGQEADGYDRYNSAYSPTNDALYTAKMVTQLYQDWFGIKILGNSNDPLIMRVHYGTGFSNAFWDNHQVTFGDGDNDLFYPLITLSIAAHEISHGFTVQHAGLEGYEQAGAIDEAFSDMAGQAAEYFVTGKNSWKIGHDFLKRGTAIRFMDIPSLDGMSIDKATDYHEELDIHFASGVYNRLFYLLATQPDWDTRKAFQVMVKANLDYWTPYSTFEEGACGILQAAQDYRIALEPIQSALKEVAISYENCAIMSYDK